MQKDAPASKEMAEKFQTEKDSPYLRFVRNDGLDIIGAQYVPDLRTVELKPWPRRGTAPRASYINHEASRSSNDCYVCEIAPGKKLEPTHHLYEEMILILSGRGSTTVWNNAGARITFEWKAGSIFAIPLNCWYQHFNGSGQDVVRFVAVTNAPSVINLYDNLDFIFNSSYDFKNRFSGEPDYFSAKGEQDGFLLRTNFVADAINLPLITAKERGAGGGHIRFNMASGTIASHISQFPVGTYKKAHAHGPGAHVIVLSRRRLFADVAGGRGAAALRMESRHPDRAAEHVVPPAFQFRADAGALSRLQALVAAQRPGRADVVDQPAPRRHPDRLRRREADGAPVVRRRARQARADPAHGRRLRGRDPEPAAEGGVSAGQRRRIAWFAYGSPLARPAATGRSGRAARLGAQRRPRPWPTSPAYSGPDRTQRLIDGAKKEGVVSLYSSAVDRRLERHRRRLREEIRHQGAALARQLGGYPRRAVTEHRGGR